MATVFTQAASPLKLNLHAPKPASRFDDLSFDPMDASPLPARGLAAAGRGTKVILTDLRKHDDLNGEVGFIVFKPDDRFDGELRYRVLLRDHPDIVFAKGSNLLVDTSVDDHPIQSLLDCFKQKLGLTASMCHSVLAQALSESMIQPVNPPAGSDGDITFRLSLLASLSPVCLEDPRGQLVDIRNERSEAEKKANERREQPSTSSAPTRASARQASADYNQPNYIPPAMLGEDGEEVEEDEDEDEEGSVAEVSDGSDSDGDASDFDFETLGAPRAPAKPSRKAKAAKKKAPTPAIAKAGGERKKKTLSRGTSASIAPGGRGFVCINPDCDEFRDTAEGIFEHIQRAHPGFEPRREVRNGTEVKCLFDGCAKPWVKCPFTGYGTINLSNVRRHESYHSIGDPLRKGFVCPSCDSLHDTADAAWACAATHGTERDSKRCLWDGCGESFRKPSHYKAHEPKHTGIWPFHCPTCGEGQKQKEMAERHCVIGAACVCGWVSYADRGKSGNEKNLAAHLKRCRAEGGLATEDTLAVGQVKRRKLNEAE